MNVDRIRKDFPFLKRKVNGKPIVYFDNAASTQKPVQMVAAVKDFYENHYANVTRGISSVSKEATDMFEQSRAKVAKFIKAGDKEVIFTSGSTGSSNIIAYSLADELAKGDKVVTTMMEHHSIFVPWKVLAKKRGLRFETVRLDGYDIDIEDFKQKARGAKVVAFTHASNALGTINNVRELSKIAHDNGAEVIVDGAQSTPHMPVDVKGMGADFFFFSAHKMLGPMGVGVLYASESRLQELDPVLYGGGMVTDVSDDVSFVDYPGKFEAGTPNVSGAVGLGAAVDYLSRMGMKNVWKREEKLGEMLWESLETKNVERYGNVRNRVALLSFNIKGFGAHDVAAVLDDEGVEVRSGHHCCLPLMNAMAVNGTVRASLYIYNTEEEIERFAGIVSELAGGR